MNSQKDKESCPNCKNSLKNHNNEQLQQCAVVELSKINQKTGGNTSD